MEYRRVCIIYFLNEDGELIHKTFGIMDTGDLIFEGKKALEKYGK